MISPRRSCAILSLVFTATSFAATPLASSVISHADAAKSSYPGAVLYQYFLGDTAGTTRTAASVIVVEPGRELHPAHKHIEEEFLFIVEGDGRWTLNGRSFPARSGDMLYAAPWDEHGLFNTGTTPLKFVVLKYQPKPAPTSAEETKQQ